MCDYRFGVCRCRAGVEGDFCDRCMDGFWGFGRNKENTCHACNCCAEGSVDNKCDKVTSSVSSKLEEYEIDCGVVFLGEWQLLV